MLLLLFFFYIKIVGALGPRLLLINPVVVLCKSTHQLCWCSLATQRAAKHAAGNQQGKGWLVFIVLIINVLFKFGLKQKEGKVNIALDYAILRLHPTLHNSAKLV